MRKEELCIYTHRRWPLRRLDVHLTAQEGGSQRILE